MASIDSFANRLPVLLLLLPLAACGGDSAASAAAPTVRDSAGIRIVENAAPGWEEAAAWRVAPEPAVDIGLVDGPAAYQLDQVRGAVRLQDGRIVVANRGSHELRFFNAAGEHLRSVGGEGGGPGEFEGLQWVGSFSADSLLAWDSGAKRLSVFDLEGNFARSVQPQGLAAMFPQFHGVLADTSFVLSPGFTPQALVAARAGERRDSLAYLRFDRSGALMDTLAHLPGAQSYLSKDDGMFSTSSVVFGRDVLLEPGGDRFYVGDNDSYQIAEHRPDGTLLRLIRRPYDPVSVGEDDVAAYYEKRSTDFSGAPAALRARMQAREEEQRKEVPHRTTLPAFASLQVDPEGNLWVEDSRRPADEQPRWSVFDPEGRWLGSVNTPVGLRVLQIGSDFVLGVWKDDLEVEHVRVYPMVKPAS
jgi:hypothetical protein